MRVIGKVLFSQTLGQRLLAMLIDLALVSLFQVWLGLVFGQYQLPTDGLDNPLIAGDGLILYASLTTTIGYFWLGASVIAYFTYFERLFGATPGKALLRIQVLRVDGARPSFGAILMRNVFRLVDALPLFYLVGGLVAQNTAHEQRAGDIVAHTMVAPRPLEPGDPVNIPRLRLKLLVTACALVALVGGCLLYQYFARPTLIIQSWANANNSFQIAAQSASAPVCGPKPQWPVPAPATNVADAQAQRPILQYALGAPQWGAGQVTYPISVQLWNDATDSGALPVLPQQVNISDMRPGPNVYTGRVVLSWVGPLRGGWVIQRSDMSCAKAG